MIFTKGLLVGAWVVASLTATGIPSSAEGRGQSGGAPSAPAAPPAVPHIASAQPAGTVAGRPLHLYGPRGLGFDLHAGWAPGFSRFSRFGPYGYDPFAYGYGGYGYGYPAAYQDLVPSYGSVRITDVPRKADVYVDGYYVGVVDDFDGTFQRLKLEPGTHGIEVRVSGAKSRTFEVTVQRGRTVTLYGELRR